MREPMTPTQQRLYDFIVWKLGSMLSRGFTSIKPGGDI